MAAESFTYADGALATVAGGAWETVDGPFTVVGNRATYAAVGSDTVAAYTTALGSADHYCEADVDFASLAGSYHVIGVCTRVDPTNQSYYAAVVEGGGGSCQIAFFGRTSPGGWTNTLAAAATIPVNTITGRLKLESIGNVHKVYWNGTEVISYTHSGVPTATKVGITGYMESGATAPFIDNLVGDLIGASQVWTRSAATVTTTGTSGTWSVAAVGPQTWTGSAATVAVTATSGTWVVTVPQTWTGSAATITTTGTSGAWSVVTGGPVPTQVEPFTYSDGALITVSGGAWEAVDGPFTVVSNKATYVSAGGFDVAAAWSTALSSANHYVEADVDLVTLSGGFHVAGVCTRVTPSGQSFYAASVDNSGGGQFVIFQRSASAPAGAVLASLFEAPGTTGRLKLESDGNTHTLYWNGVQKLQVSSSAVPTATKVGITGYMDVGATAPTFDNWAAGPINAPLPPVSVSGRKLVKAGSPFLIKTMSGWPLAQRLSNADITFFLTHIKSLGFNTVTFGPCGFQYGTASTWGNKWANIAGDQFFATTAGGNTAAAPISGQLGAAWQSVDWAMDECERLDLHVVWAFCYTGYANQDGIGNDLIAAGTSAAYTYGVRMGQRYGARTHLMLHYGQDYGFDWGTAPAAHADQIFKGWFDGSSTTRADWVILNEPNMGNTTYSQVTSQAQPGVGVSGYGWCIPNVNATYGFVSANPGAEIFEDTYNQTGATSMPVWRCEMAYDGSPWMDGPQNRREELYSTYLEGGIGSNWGSEYINSFGADTPWQSTPDWRAHLNDPEVLRTQYAWTLFDTYCADMTFAPSSWVTTGEGSGDTKTPAGASSTAALAYVSANRAYAVNTTILGGSGNVRLRWYDPCNGTFTTISAAEGRQTNRSVTYPGTNSGGAPDWVLVVDALVPAAVVKVGTTTLANVKLGTTQLQRMYLGTTRMWTYAAPAPGVWLRSPATVAVTATSGTWALVATAQTWTRSAATISVTATSGAWSSGPQTWTRSDATVAVTATSGTWSVASAAFSPASLPTLSAWFDASDAASFTFGTATAVATWNDKSPNGFHVSQATAANRPTRNGTTNGLTTVVFDGSNDWLQRLNAPINNATNGSFTLFAVFRPTTTSGNHSVIDADSGSGSGRISQYLRSTGTSMECITFDGGGPWFTNGGTITTTVARRARVVCTGATTTKLYLSGTEVASSNQTVQVYSASAYLTIGNNSDTTSAPWAGQICEIVMCASALSAGDITSMETYLTTKWGVT